VTGDEKNRHRAELTMA